MQMLNVRYNKLTPASLEALAGAPEAGRLPELAELNMADNHFDDDVQSSSALARAAPHLSALHVLHCPTVP